MSLPTKIINVRLSAAQAEQFRRLKDEFSGLPQATILRLLIASFLEMPLERQVEVVTAQIRKPAGNADPKLDKNRLGSGTNRNRTPG